MASLLPGDLEAGPAESFDNFTPREERELRQSLRPFLLWFAA
jgi:hypothetical protein